jgi:8-oxo-dGTP diphosphatase
MTQEFRYCQWCGTQLESQAVGLRVLHRCPNCHHIAYPNPKIAIAVIVDMDGKILLQRRAIEPGVGLWSFPAGYMDQGETVEGAARRETLEETGVRVALDSLVGIYSNQGNPVVLVVYAGHVIQGIPYSESPEVQEVGLFELDDLPPLAFPHDHSIIKDWRRHRGE